MQPSATTDPTAPQPSPPDTPDAPAPSGAPIVNDPTSNPRFASAIVFVISSAVLAVAFGLTPSDEGVGTHKAIGLPACGMLEATGIPCMTCGMTTSFSHAAHGDFVTAFTNQPAGALLAVLTAMAAVLSGYALVTGMSLAPIGAALWRPRVIVIAVVLAAVAWGYKIIIVTGWFGANS